MNINLINSAFTKNFTEHAVYNMCFRNNLFVYNMMENLWCNTKFKSSSYFKSWCHSSHFTVPSLILSCVSCVGFSQVRPGGFLLLPTKCASSHIGHAKIVLAVGECVHG